ncbi:hypothetical protein DL770_010875 [Monosporascus sp. CRB-9-2]|nr:hypothetical protein DL770_010875 [Monosporascus sp. CRB-9-2]
MVVLDADRAFAAVDTGVRFWQGFTKAQPLLAGGGKGSPKSLFECPLGYSFKAFLQAALLYEETRDDREYDLLCALILACGLRLVWEKALEKEGLTNVVNVFGNGLVGNGHIMTPSPKAAAVVRLRDAHQMYVWALGDIPLDLLVLREASQAIVIVWEERGRSSTTEPALLKATDNNGLQA